MHNKATTPTAHTKQDKANKSRKGEMCNWRAKATLNRRAATQKVLSTKVSEARGGNMDEAGVQRTRSPGRGLSVEEVCQVPGGKGHGGTRR